MQEFRGAGCLRIRTVIRLSHAIGAGPNRFGQRIIAYDLNSNTPGGRFYPPQDPTSTELTAGIYIDRTSIGVFVDGGLYSYSYGAPPGQKQRREVALPGQPYRNQGVGSILRPTDPAAGVNPAHGFRKNRGRAKEKIREFFLSLVYSTRTKFRYPFQAMRPMKIRHDRIFSFNRYGRKTVKAIKALAGDSAEATARKLG